MINGSCLICSPESWIPDLLFAAHDDPLAGRHCNAKKMYSKLKTWVFFENMKGLCELWAASCSLCSMLKKTTRKIHTPLQPMVMRKRFSHWALDILPGLPVTKRGNSSMLCCQDRVTKWIRLVPLQSMDAPTVIQAFYENVVSLFGQPLSLISDGGPQFCSELSKNLAKTFNMTWEFSSPRHQSANGQIESSMRTVYAVNRAVSWMPDELKAHILNFAGGTQDWDLRVNLLLLAYHNSVCS